jgi:hypothetical protein
MIKSYLYNDIIGNPSYAIGYLKQGYICPLEKGGKYSMQNLLFMQKKRRKLFIRFKGRLQALIEWTDCQTFSGQAINEN